MVFVLLGLVCLYYGYIGCQKFITLEPNRQYEVVGNILIGLNTVALLAVPYLLYEWFVDVFGSKGSHFREEYGLPYFEYLYFLFTDALLILFIPVSISIVNYVLERDVIKKVYLGISIGVFVLFYVLHVIFPGYLGEIF